MNLVFALVILSAACLVLDVVFLTLTFRNLRRAKRYGRSLLQFRNCTFEPSRPPDPPRR